MSHPEGVYLGGIRTVECLRKRSRVDECTGCWHWGMACVQGSPKVHYVAPDTGLRIAQRGRRAALHLQRGADLPAKRYAIAKCDSDDCVNPEHSRVGTRTELGQWLRRSGRVKNLPSKSAASRKGWDGRRKLTPADVVLIRTSTETDQQLAARLGVSAFCVWSARIGKSHRHVMAGASVFNWLPTSRVGMRG